MLQQTQVSTVIGYYGRFLERFPDVKALAAAPLEEVLQYWAGLGYYARARLAHRCAQAVVQRADAQFPATAAELERLPGIGPSTAAAIAAFCFSERAAILDANVKRVLARYRAIDGDPKRPAVLACLWEAARAMLPAASDMARYTQGIMDLGATVCTRNRPLCGLCPVSGGCQARLQGRAAELPQRSPVAPRAQRSLHLLVAVHGNAVLVEERPPAGIWGGLLSLPEFAQTQALRNTAQALGARTLESLPERLHGFTHFTLAFTPHVARLADDPVGVPAAQDAPSRRWLPLADVETAALPAPIRTLLRDIRSA